MGIHISGIGVDADPPEIESICVPTRPYGRITVVSKIGMPGAGKIEQLKLLIAHLKAPSPKLACISSAPLPMIGISEFILPLTVMKECE